MVPDRLRPRNNPDRTPPALNSAVTEIATDDAGQAFTFKPRPLHECGCIRLWQWQRPRMVVVPCFTAQRVAGRLARLLEARGLAVHGLENAHEGRWDLDLPLHANRRSRAEPNRTVPCAEYVGTVPCAE